METGFDHLEQSEFGGGAETMLRSTKQTQRVVALTFELQHRVDHVLEDSRSGEATLFGDVTHQDDRHVASLGFHHQLVRASAYLHNAAGSRTEFGIDECLDAVDDDQFGLEFVECSQHVGENGLGQQPQLGSHRTETLGAKPHLLRALLGRYVQGSTGPSRERLQQQRALADAGLATEKSDRTRDESATEHTIELGNTRGARRSVRDVDVADALGRTRGEQRNTGRQRRDVVGRIFDIFDQCVPGSARRAAAGPLRKRGPAVGAVVDEFEAGHTENLRPGCSMFGRSANRCGDATPPPGVHHQKNHDAHEDQPAAEDHSGDGGRGLPEAAVHFGVDGSEHDRLSASVEGSRPHHATFGRGTGGLADLAGKPRHHGERH